MTESWPTEWARRGPISKVSSILLAERLQIAKKSVEQLDDDAFVRSSAVLWKELALEVHPLIPQTYFESRVGREVRRGEPCAIVFDDQRLALERDFKDELDAAEFTIGLISRKNEEKHCIMRFPYAIRYAKYISYAGDINPAMYYFCLYLQFSKEMPQRRIVRNRGSYTPSDRKKIQIGHRAEAFIIAVFLAHSIFVVPLAFFLFLLHFLSGFFLFPILL